MSFKWKKKFFTTKWWIKSWVLYFNFTQFLALCASHHPSPFSFHPLTISENILKKKTQISHQSHLQNLILMGVFIPVAKSSWYVEAIIDGPWRRVQDNFEEAQIWSLFALWNNVYVLAVFSSTGLCPNGAGTTKLWTARQGSQSWEKPAPVFNHIHFNL